MLRTYQKGHNVVKKHGKLPALADLSGLIWVDLQDPSLEEIEQVEKAFKVNIPTRVQQEEIEWSSRYAETESYIVANSNFIQYSGEANFYNIHVSFIIQDEVLITYREGDLYSFADCVKKIKSNAKIFTSGKIIFIILLETRVDFDADLLEYVSGQIHELGKKITEKNGTQTEIVQKITSFQETTLMVRQNILDKHRVVSSMLRSNDFTKKEKARMQIIIEDINSLIKHTNFLFTRLDYLQESFMGMINIDQNKIIKIFTIVSVVFMPPTLIASIYGMNFRFMPELSWKIGYPVALVIIVLSSLVTLFIFKKRKWL
jgi:magnesium transporter